MLPVPSTIPAMLAESARRYAERPAIVDGGFSIGYAALYDEARRAARALIALDVQPGERVALWAPNLHEWIVAALGVHFAGAALVPLNTRFKGEEVADILNRSRARVLFSIGEFLGVRYPDMLAGHALPSLRHTVVLRDGPSGAAGWDAFVALAGATPEAVLDARIAAIAPRTPSDVLFTSGTTGRPKGVVTAHGQNLAAFDQWSALVGLQAGDRYLIINPFFHAFGYKAGWLAALIRGATILPQATFDADAVLRRIADERVTFLPGSPTLYLSLLAHPDLDRFDRSSLRVAVTGAANVAPDLIARMRDRLGFTSVLTAYGLTECCGLATVCRAGDDERDAAATCGRPLPEVELRCIDGTGADVPRGMPGEILIRGFNVMQGYLDDDAATRDAIDANGWLHTGDVGVLDERGYLRITDRLKDLYIVGGFNCYPAEIENMIAAHPDVAQVAVIGVPDARLGEAGKAFVVPRAGGSLDEATLAAWCRTRMANYKIPRDIAFVDALPLNASGKVLKQVLREASAQPAS
ncbi:AMP-binding protein [Burkholderia pyrrocinia]|uniref:FadD3 family acyl-CoA ligase n=1 Tax=Burkholderia pyrrocinia TaxID=60550 RepID=UPI0015774AE0|nr:FadD3 family acyl-CoA ligase [Burkholderia pyrrocinia]NTX28143.1 AMP-binding protein [Burkholderia pyrrocinia]